MAKDKKVEQITDMEADFAQWYTDVCTKAQLIDYSSIKGMFVYRPYGYAIWENIQHLMDAEFKKTGAVNVYMPMLIPESLLQKEKDHVEGFAPECAWVTYGGSEKLEERYCIRPTSSMLLVNCSSAGIFMPGRLGCTRAAERLSTSAGSADHTCTSLPLTHSIRASAMPQVPAPKTPIFFFVTFVSSVSAPHRAAVPGGKFAPMPVLCPVRVVTSIVHESRCAVNRLPHCTKFSRWVVRFCTHHAF